jgi:hypothetical protein
VAATAGTASAPLATASPSAASNAAKTTVIVLRDLFSKSLVIEHLHEAGTAHRPAPLRASDAQRRGAQAPSGS